MHLKKSLAFGLLVLLPSGASAQKAYEIPRTQVVPIRDSQAGGQYELYIKLPEEYSEKKDVRYPVIYTTDAVWHIEMLSAATEYLMPNVILVGISWQKDLDDERPHVSRYRDYTFIESKTAKVATGGARGHLAFIRNDVINYIENTYRSDPDGRTYYGYSVGAKFGAYTLFSEPDTFQNYILGSPSFNETDLAYIDDLEAKMASGQKGMSANVFVSIGELETEKMQIAEDFVSVLERRAHAGLALTGLEVIEASDHGTAFPMTVIRSVKWLSQLRNDATSSAE